MKQSEFIVRRFVNRNGATSWRVAGWLHGVRIRKNLPTREEAAAEKAALEIKAIQAASGLRPALTCLSDEQLREAESVFRSVADRKRGLTFYVNFALTNYRDTANEKALTDAAAEYVARREADEKLGHLSHRQFTSFRCELRALTGHFPGANVCELTPARLTVFFQRGAASKKSFNNRRGLVSAFLKYCLLQDWIAANPIEKVPHFAASAIVAAPRPRSPPRAAPKSWNGSKRTTMAPSCPSPRSASSPASVLTSTKARFRNWSRSTCASIPA